MGLGRPLAHKVLSRAGAAGPARLGNATRNCQWAGPPLLLPACLVNAAERSALLQLRAHQQQCAWEGRHRKADSPSPLPARPGLQCRALHAARCCSPDDWRSRKQAGALPEPRYDWADRSAAAGPGPREPPPGFAPANRRCVCFVLRVFWGLGRVPVHAAGPCVCSVSLHLAAGP